MFPRAKRLPRTVFPAATSSAQRVSTPHFMAVLPDGGSGYAVVVSKKVARLSVTRHRLKRRIVAVLRTLPLPGALVVFPRASAVAMDFATTKAELAQLISKISGSTRA